MDNGERSNMVDRWKTDKSLNSSNVSQCSLCKNKRFKRTCLAYPDEIPKEILFNNVIHDKTTRNDNGIIFEPKSDKYVGVKFNPMG